MDSESTDTADWHEAQDRRPDGQTDWTGKQRAVTRYKEGRKKGIRHIGEEEVRTIKEKFSIETKRCLQKWDVGKRYSKGRSKMTDHVFCWASALRCYVVEFPYTAQLPAIACSKSSAPCWIMHTSAGGGSCWVEGGEKNKRHWEN